MSKKLLGPIAGERDRKKRRVGRQSRQHVIVVPVIPVLPPGEETRGAMHIATSNGAKGLVDADDPARARHWEGAQRDAVQHGEDAGVDADAERNGNHSYGGETRILAQRAR